MSKIFRILGPLLIVIGGIVAYFSQVPVADYIGIASSVVGLTLSIIAIIKKSDKPTWKTIVPIICFGVGAVFCALAGIGEESIKTLAIAVIGVVGIIVGLITTQKLKS